MKSITRIIFILFVLRLNSLYARNPNSVKQFINHADWNFVENKGQITDKGIAYYGHQGGVYLYCKPGMIRFVFTKIEKEGEQISEATSQPSGFLLSGKGAGGFGQRSPLSALRSSLSTSRADLILLHANPSARIIASDQQEYYENFYTTGNADSGITNVHTYKTITYKDIYPDIDMVLMAKPNGVEYSFVVYPGGKVSDIQMQWVGIEGIIRRDAYGKKLKDFGIEYSCSLGKMEESAPYSYVGADTRVRPYEASQTIESQFILKNNCIGFKVDRYDKSKVLVIDPTLVWGTYFGGSGNDAAYSIMADKFGGIYITGGTESINGIATAGAYQTYIGGIYTGFDPGGGDAFISKFNTKGKLLWSTYYGGNRADEGHGIASDSSGFIYIVGWTNSDSGIATKGAFQTSFMGLGSGGSTEAFLAKFHTDGTIIWATYYGDYYTSGSSVITDALGNIYITGTTNGNTGIATSGAYQTNLNGPDLFLAKFDGNGNLKWGTYYGNYGATEVKSYAYCVNIDNAGNVYFSGSWTDVHDFPLSQLVKFDSKGQIKWHLNLNSYVSNMVDCSWIDLDKFNNLYLTGSSFDSFGSEDVFLAKFDSSGSFKWSKQYGGQGSDGGTALISDAIGNLVVTGFTQSPSGIATTGAYQSTFSGIYDAFLAKFDSKGGLLWATYYGGKSDEGSYGIVTDGHSNFYITGTTGSATGIATSGAYQTSYAGHYDAFLAKFGTIPTNDAGISSILNPNTSTCADSQTVKVQLHNYGINELDSVTIAFSVNSQLVPLYYWKGKLLPDSSISVTLGKFLFTSGKDTIKAWTSMPNGFKDSVPENDTSSTIINVLPMPAAYTGPNQAICYPAVVLLGTTGVTGDTYSWTSKPTGFSSTLSNPNFSYVTKTTTFYLTETNPAGCSKTDSVILTIKSLPPDIVIPDTAICTGDSIGLADSLMNGFNYLWISHNSGFSSTLSNPVVKPTMTTSYIMRLVNIKTGCESYDSVKVTVNPLPVPAIDSTHYTICTGTHIRIGGNSTTGMAYLWTSDPVGFTSTLSGPIVNPDSNITYFLTETNTKTGCSSNDSSKVTVTIPKAPVSSPGFNQTICMGGLAVLGADPVGGMTYSWESDPAGFISSSPKAGVKPDTTTTYYLTVKNAISCTDVGAVTVKVNPLPVVNAGLPQKVCAGTIIQIGSSPVTGYIYQWTSNPTGFSSSISDPIDSPNITTEYYLNVTIDSTGCANSDSVKLTVFPRPYVHFDVKNLNGFEYQFSAKNPNYPSWQYHWSFGDTSSTGASSTGADTADGYIVNHIYLVNGKYKVVLTVSLPGLCTEIDSYLVVVNEQFSLNIFPNPFGLQTDIKYTLVNPGHVRISLTDEIGRQLGTLLDKQLSQGEYDTHFDAALWKTRPAMYFVIFHLDDKVIVKKIIQLDSIFY